MSWRERAEELKFKQNYSWSKVAETIKNEYMQDNSTIAVLEQVRRYLRGTPEYQDRKTIIKKPIGVFADVHIPFEHPNYLTFIKDTFKKYGVGQIICMGDLVDNHAISRHQTEDCAKSPYDELDMSISKVKEYVKAFPKVKMCQGNHDTIPERQAATAGIGKRYLKSFSDLMELPKTWEIADEYIIDNVLYKHGLNCLGKDGALNSAIQERMSVVIGHSHSFGGCKYSANKRNIIFGLNAGCGIDIDAYAFIYGNHAKFRPTLGCGIVFNESYAVFVPMQAQYFRSNNI